MESLSEYVETSRLVDWAKASLNIIKLNGDMTNDDIREVIRWVGERSKDTVYIDGDKPVYGRLGIGVMLSITLLEFPEFYSRYELAQFN